MPRYKCHKIVHALKIAALDIVGEAVMLTPADPGYAAFPLDTKYLEKHQPQAGGYYVVYEPDGYASYSPAKAFEEGYTKTNNEKTLVECPDCKAALKIVGDKLALVKHAS